MMLFATSRVVAGLSWQTVSHLLKLGRGSSIVKIINVLNLTLVNIRKGTLPTGHRAPSQYGKQN